MRYGAILLGLLMALAIPASQWAHEGHAHVVMGIVTAVDANHVEVKAEDGDVISARLTKDTKHYRGEKPATRADVKKGLRAVLRVKTEGNIKQALEVRLPPEK